MNKVPVVMIQVISNGYLLLKEENGIWDKRMSIVLHNSEDLQEWLKENLQEPVVDE